MQIILEREKSGFYRIKNGDDETIIIIAYFLTDDVGGHSKETFTQWALEWEQDYIAGNATISIKKGNLVTIELLTDEDSSISLTKVQYIYLMEQWYQLREMKAQEIIISLENNVLTIEGRNAIVEPTND